MSGFWVNEVDSNNVWEFTTYKDLVKHYNSKEEQFSYVLSRESPIECINYQDSLTKHYLYLNSETGEDICYDIVFGDMNDFGIVPLEALGNPDRIWKRKFPIIPANLEISVIKAIVEGNWALYTQPFKNQITFSDNSVQGKIGDVEFTSSDYVIIHVDKIGTTSVSMVQLQIKGTSSSMNYEIVNIAPDRLSLKLIANGETIHLTKHIP